MEIKGPFRHEYEEQVVLIFTVGVVSICSFGHRFRIGLDSRYPITICNALQRADQIDRTDEIDQIDRTDQIDQIDRRDHIDYE